MYPPNGPYGNWRRNDANNWMEPAQLPAPIIIPANEWNMGINEVDPGMNGDGVGGWQGQGGRGNHHMGGGGRRNMGGHNQQPHQQNRMPNQHHGGVNHRMMPPNFRHQQPQQQPYAYVPEMMDMNMIRLNEMSLNGGGPPNPVIPGQNVYVDVPPHQQANWCQPQPFAPQEEMYDHVAPFGVPPNHNGMPVGGGGSSQYGGNGRGGYNRGGSMGQGSRQGGGGYRQHHQQQQPQSFGMPMQMQQHQIGGPPQGGQQPFYGQQQQPFVTNQMGGGGGGGGGGHHGGGMQQNQIDIGHFGGPPSGRNGGGGGGAIGNDGFPITTSTMDDYSMWTDENDEETKKKKILRDKGLLVWGDAETSNSKPIRRWLVGEGQEEDIDTAMARCPHYQKKKSVHEEALKRRLTSENQQVAQQAQQQLDEERSAMLRVGRRPVVACGWGDLPAELAEKSGSQGNIGPSSNETRNPFFAQHMQQQQHHGGGGMGGNQHQQHQQQQQLYMDPSAMNDGVWGAVNQYVTPPLPVGPPMVVGPGVVMGGAGGAGGGGVQSAGEPIMDENRQKVAENLRYAVEKGHLDIGLLSLTHIPPNVLDLLTIILAKIPVLDNNEAELKNLTDVHRPPEVSSDEDPKTWLTEDLKLEYDKLVINVVTAKIEVTDLSKKINRALGEAGLTKRQGNGEGGAGPSHGDGSGQNRPDGFDNGPPDQCDFYDYAFLG